MKIGTILVVLVLVFFALPIFNDDTILPNSLDPNQLGEFVRRAFEYWQTLVTNIVY